MNRPIPSFLDQVKITRCDVAHDFFGGQYTPEQAYADYRCLLYRNGKQPKCEKRGTAWENEDGSGKTLYIGSRYGAKLARIYEKGRQLGDKASRWVRFEVEFRAHDYEIPTDILIYPGEYLCGAYPVGARLFQNSAKRKITKQARKGLTVQRAAYFPRLQAGAFVRYQHDLGRTDGEIVRMLIAPPGKYPKGLHPLDEDCTAHSILSPSAQGMPKTGRSEPVSVGLWTAAVLYLKYLIGSLHGLCW
ncbi:replication initiation factor domain-containing protein [Neisseria shayeganii]|uniref:replication initiation factor domain-containing protein n=1 Tax=Neisseria shayeganii TaxID=607712 RepID=UPI000682A93F|nr:replication initiation factor domain-containing protein [Neisseria shayeganii]